MPQRRRRAGLRRGHALWGPLASSPRITPSAPALTQRHRIWPWGLVLLAAVLLVPVGYFGYNILSTLNSIQTGNGPLPGGPGGAPRGTTYVLLMGSDERRDARGQLQPGEVPHSDTMIMAALDTDNHTIRILSVPRDLLVTIPGYGPNHRINEAYTIGETKHLAGGGPALAAATMAALTGIQAQYYAVTTFDGFRQTVNAVGGVVIDAERPISDHDYPGEGYDYMPVYVAAGRQLMDGEKALEFVRSRHDDPLGDFGRNLRQQKFVAALAKKLLRPERLAQFSQFSDIVKNSVRTNLETGQMLSMAQSMLSARGHVQTYAVGPADVREPTEAQRAAYGAVLIPDRQAIGELVAAFQRGDPPPDRHPASPPGG